MNRQEAVKIILEAESCFCQHGAYKYCNSRCKYKDALYALMKDVTEAEEEDPYQADMDDAWRQSIKQEDYTDTCKRIADKIRKYHEELKEDETETWNGFNCQITAPKGTFEKIWNEAKENE